MKKVWIAVVAFAVMGVLASAQEKTKEMEGQQRLAAYQAANAPNEHHEFLKKFSGDWGVQMTFWTAPGKPPVTSRATAMSDVRFGGRFLFISFTGEMMGKPFAGQQIVGYDNMEKMYNTFYMDNTSTHIFVTKGVRLGDVISETGSWPDPVTGRVSGVHARTTFLNNDEYRYEQFMVQDDGTEVKMLELRCQRKK
ncbi:MAG TPA: DUF1579 family protein [Acidobacteriota bacterium]